MKSVFIIGVVAAFLSGCKNPVEENVETTKPPTYENYTLVWHDEFNGGILDAALWNYETGTGVNGDFGTGQIDRATNRVENVSVVMNVPGADDGCLLITTRKERYIDRDYTSGRIQTKGKGAWGPGHKIEARIWPKGVRYKGQGFAFWMMPAEHPSDQPSIMWPQGGEIDIMEFVGSLPYHNLSSVHYAWSWNNNEWAQWNHGHQGGYYSYDTRAVPPSVPVYEGYSPNEFDSSAGSGQFRLYGIDWFADRIEFSIDRNIYHIHYFNDGDAFHHGMSDGQDKNGVVELNGRRVMLSEYSNHFAEWHPFEKKFFIILSSGVGGNDNLTYGGAIIPEAVFPCTVYIDWIRVYHRETPMQ